MSDPLLIRILSELSARRVAVGSVVTVDVDRVFAHDGTGPVIARTLEKHGIEELAGADRMVLVYDHYYPPVTLPEAEMQQRGRAFARRYGIPIYAGEGICHQVLLERGLVAPGKVLIGADSHTSTAGALGALAIGLGATDVAAVVASGRMWLEVPETIRIRLSGRLDPEVDGHDLALTVVGKVGMQGGLGKVLEYVGPGVEHLAVSDRLKVTNFSAEMGAVTGIMGLDDRGAAWLEARGADLSSRELVELDRRGSDADLEIDLAEVKTSVAAPSSPDATRALDELEDSVRVDQVFIGTCAGGRLEDLQAAATVLRGRRIKPGLRFLVGPASTEVLTAALEDGTLGTLLAAGAILLPVGCGACMGRQGALGEGEVEVAVQNRNFVGRAGHPGSQIYLASAVTAARCALTGTLGPETVGPETVGPETMVPQEAVE